MANNLQSDRGEQGIPASLVILTVGVAVLGAVVAVANRRELSQQEHFSEQVQRYNPQLHTQLERQYDPLQDLVIHHDGKHFSFHTKSDTQVPLSCEGTMQVEHGTATAVGAIICTQTVHVPQ